MQIKGVIRNELPSLLALFTLLALITAACTTTPARNVEPVSSTTPPPAEETVMMELPVLGPAPEILNEVWINADKPVTIASQKGKVVLLEFWTFG